MCCCKEVKKFDQLGFSRVHSRKGYQSYTGLLAIAEEQKTAGQMDIAEFVFKRNEKVIPELVTETWQIESAKEKLEGRKASRIDTVKRNLTSDYV